MNKYGIAFALLLAGLAPQTQAVGVLTDVTIYDRKQHKILPVYEHDGRYYVVGRPGNEYQINLHNRSGGEVEAVISVDGVNAVTGETAGWEQTGYVLNTGIRAGITGWRKSQDHVATFYFTRLPDSYAARTQRPDNVGVIGVAVFRRKVEPQPVPFPYLYPDREDYLSEQHGGPAPAGEPGSLSSQSAPRDDSAVTKEQRAESNLGTGHGRNEYSHVTYTDFERATDQPAEIITIYYNSYSNLVAQGVIPVDRTIAVNPFPRNVPGFVPDP